MKIAVIGGGPGGVKVASRAAGLGHRVTIIEEGSFGGTCTNHGCIPTKFLLAAAARENVRSAGKVQPEAWTGIQARKKALVGGLSGKIAKDLAGLGVTILKGRGMLAGPGLAVCTGADGARTEVPADAVVLACGSRPARISSLGMDGTMVLSSDDAMELSAVPDSVIIIGSGFIGSEFARLFRLLGSSVTVLEALPHILPSEDEDTSAAVRREFERGGIAVHTGAKVTGVAVSGASVTVTVEGGGSFTADKALVSIGRDLNTSGIGLESAGLSADARGALPVNEFMETAAGGVYAVGDITGKPMLAHVAETQGSVLADRLSGEGRGMDYRAVPWAVFVSPEVATAGLTEKAAAATGVDCLVGKAPFTRNIKARIEGEQAGFVKILAERATGRLLGGTIVGPRAADMIHVVSMAVDRGLAAGDLARMIFIHPTLSESFREAAEQMK